MKKKIFSTVHSLLFLKRSRLRCEILKQFTALTNEEDDDDDDDEEEEEEEEE